MKIINTMILGVCLISVSACNDLQNWNSTYLGGGGEYLKNDKGLVADCRGELILINYTKPSEADRFWQKHNLPSGTKNYVCKDYKAYLPDKVTDCNGNNIIIKYGSVDKFRIVNNLPNYTTVAFICEDTSIKPSPDQIK